MKKVNQKKLRRKLYSKDMALMYVLMSTIFTVLCMPVFAQEYFSVSYGFDLVVSGSGGRVDPTPVPYVEGLVFSPFMAVANNEIWGMGENPSSAERFSFRGWPLAAVDSLPSTGSIDSTQYFELSIAVDSGYFVFIDQVSFGLERSATGVRRFALRSNKHQFENNLPVLYDNPDDKILVLEDQIIEFKDLSVSTKANVELVESFSISGPDLLVLRFYAWSAERSTGTFSMDDIYIGGRIYADSAVTVTQDTMVAGSSYVFPALACDENQTSFSLVYQVDSQLVSSAFYQTLSMQRPCFDAALNLYNMQNTSALEQLNIELELFDTLGRFCNEYFDLNLYVPDSVGALSNNMALIRVFPEPQLPTEYQGPYLLGGHFSYIDRESGLSASNLLFPMSVFPEAFPDCRIHYFVPEAFHIGLPGGDSTNNAKHRTALGFMIENHGDGIARQIYLGHPQSGQSADFFQLEGIELNKSLIDKNTDSLCIDSLPAGQSLSLLWWFSASLPAIVEGFSVSSVHEDPFKHPDSSLFRIAGVHKLSRLVEAYAELDDNKLDFLVNAHEDPQYLPDSLFLSQGLRFPVYNADSLVFDISPWDADSALVFTLFPARSGWNYFRLQHPALNVQAEVLSVKRLDDALNLPSRNVWLTAAACQDDQTDTQDNYLHILDNSHTAQPQTYEVILSNWYESLIIDSLRATLCEGEFYSFGGLLIEEAGIYYDTLTVEQAPDTLKILLLDKLNKDVVALTDSICIGEAYLKYGFNLTPHQDAGSYFYSDTLQNQWGCDSILHLNLVVNTPPQDPGPIFGDSLVVVAGNYTYTIKPVPNASFYIWTVLPPYWQKTTQGHSLSLNIPYNGSGTISVKAVNCCGESASSSLQINGQSALEQEEQTSSFSIFPDTSLSGFVLETSGIEGKTSICISSMTGQILSRQTKHISPQDSRFEFSLEAYTQGMYIISIVNEQVSGVEKLIRE